jgi:protein LTV1
MQHMRDLGASTEGHFVEAPQLKQKAKGKGKQTLEDALRDASIDDTKSTASSVRGSGPLLDEDILPNLNLRRKTYQDQQDVPDALRGFKPDMDPRLREALEALEDEAYVDDEDDIFGELAQDGEELDLDEFEMQGEQDLDGFDDDGWESDATVKAGEKKTQKSSDLPTANSEEVEGAGEGDWMAEFSKFKKDEKSGKTRALPSELVSAAPTTSTSMTGRRKKRKGALTNGSSYSMTSSSLVRTEGHTTLDARFDKIEEEYANDDFDDEASAISGFSKMSSMSKMSTNSKSTNYSMASDGPVREDFDSILDDFLGGYSMSGKKHVKKGKYQSGLEQLEELRKGLGPARRKKGDQFSVLLAQKENEPQKASASKMFAS